MRQLPALVRAASTVSKHPKGFVAPSQADLEELRERVQEFTSEFGGGVVTFFFFFVFFVRRFAQKNKTLLLSPLTKLAEREITEDVAARTDAQNEFPVEMWKKLGDAG